MKTTVLRTPIPDAPMSPSALGAEYHGYNGAEIPLLNNVNFGSIGGRLGESNLAPKPIGDEDFLSVLTMYYDMTYERVSSLFSVFDHSGNGEISYEECKKMFDIYGIYMDSGYFDKLMKFVDEDSSQTLSLDEFAVMIQRLKMLILFQPSTVSQILKKEQIGLVSRLCFSSLKCTTERPVHSPDAFFLNADPVWPSVHFVHVSDSDSLTMQRLGVKYRLHPLVIEDIVFREKRVKVDKYKTHLLITIPWIAFSHELSHELIQLMENDYVHTDSLKQKLNMMDPLLSIESNDGVGTSQSSSTQQLVSQLMSESMNEWANERSNKYHIRMVPLNIIYVHDDPWVRAKNTVITIQHTSGHDLWDSISKLMENKNNRGRGENGMYMVYAVLDYVVDHYISIIQQLAERVLTIERSTHNTRLLVESALISRELDNLCKHISPLTEVIPGLINDPICSQRMKSFFSDTLDHVNQLLNDIRMCSERSSHLYSLVQDSRVKRQENVLLILTVVTVIFTPMSFAAGVFGMNFDVMPLIHDPLGYLKFWIVIGIVTALLLFGVYIAIKKIYRTNKKDLGSMTGI